jgi:signal peptidase I
LTAPGLGQFYNVQMKKGVIYFLAHLIFPTFLILAGLLNDFIGAVIFMGISSVIYLFIAGDAFVIARKKKEAALKSYNRWYVYASLIVITSAISMGYNAVFKDRIYPYKSYKIPAGSMYPALYVGDHIIVDMKCYEAREPQRGDVVIFRYPENREKDFIKRIIAVGGDVIEGRERVIYLNGSALDEPYVRFDDKFIKPRGNDPRDNFGPLAVPENKYFMMGDRRDQSYDSRYWGFVDAEDIRGKALYIYFSLDKERDAVRFERIGKSVNYSICSN